MSKQPNEYLAEIVSSDSLQHRIAYVLWSCGATAQSALWEARQVTDLLIDMAGHGELLKAIDAIGRE